MQIDEFVTLPLNDWALTDMWPKIEKLKLDDYSSYAGHYRTAAVQRSRSTATIKFIDNEPIGLAVYERPHWTLRPEYTGHRILHFEIYIDPWHRAKGHGKSLFEHVTAHHRDCMIQVFPWDVKSRSFFASVGVNMETSVFDQRESTL